MISWFSFIAVPCGWLMKIIYDFVGNYAVALLLFTVLTKVLLFPLGIKQQKSMAKMSAYNPMMQEIQKKYAKDKARQQEELMKFQQETGYNPMAGCLPMLIQMPILMGLIGVIYEPVRYIIGIPKEVITQCGELLTASGVTITQYVDTAVISAIQNGSVDFSSVLSAEQITAVQNFDFTLFGFLDLTQVPTFGFNLLVIIPILSAVSMVFSQIVTTKMSGQQLEGSMKVMPYTMSLMFVYFGFIMPAGVSLYWIFTNVLGLVQSVILKKMYDPEKVKEQVMAEIEAAKKNRNKRKEVVVKDEEGKEVVKNLNAEELARVRLARARAKEQDLYND